jgi:hypothetical protein
LTLAGTLSVPLPFDPAGLALEPVPFSISDDWLRYFIHQNPLWTYRNETYQQYLTDFQTSITAWAGDQRPESLGVQAAWQQDHHLARPRRPAHLPAGNGQLLPQCAEGDGWASEGGEVCQAVPFGKLAALRNR